MRLSRFTILSTALVLSACGFTPLYATHDGGPGVPDQFQTVKIANIPDRDGQILRNDLVDRFYKEGIPAEPRYILSIQPIEERSTDIDILPTSDASRAELRLITYLTLTDAKTGAELLHRDLFEATSYNILSSEYTTIVSQENVRRNALNALAQQIETQMALYFARTPETASKP